MTLHESGTGSTAEETHRLTVELDLLKGRVSRLEQQVRTLAEANLALARGMEANPLEEPDQTRPAHSARLAHELLLAADLVPPKAESE
ncbi:hypothetical protein [Microtetraspora malaysiensis]|uniref:Uncharacterized protein n=1 Tax=Microtetraspora malaysiensis TaxID=161358 RepID=A0ABW6T1S8_9ACTN|nr:hypothetical protein [Microtetraspora malaysiensis]